MRESLIRRTPMTALEGRQQASRGGFALTRFLSVEALQSRADEPLSALGIDQGHGARVRCGAESFFVIVES